MNITIPSGNTICISDSDYGHGVSSSPVPVVVFRRTPIVPYNYNTNSNRTALKYVTYYLRCPEVPLHITDCLLIPIFQGKNFLNPHPITYTPSFFSRQHVTRALNIRCRVYYHLCFVNKQSVVCVSRRGQPIVVRYTVFSRSSAL